MFVLSEVNAAFPDFILNNVQLDAKYADLTFDKDDAYFTMLDKVRFSNLISDVSHLARPYPSIDFVVLFSDYYSIHKENPSMLVLEYTQITC